MVTVVTTGVGLAVAAIADGTKGESIAKSLIFMPMAISFVGAGIIWRFMYIARPPVQDQTGVLNALWVGLGHLSISSWATPVAIGSFVFAAALVLLGIRGFAGGSLSLGWSSVLLAMPFAWFGVRLLDGAPIGGLVEGPGGQMIAAPILFLSGTQQVGAYNNLFVMLPFIWIYTGFAMVIFSAAIKAVPADRPRPGRVRDLPVPLDLERLPRRAHDDRGQPRRAARDRGDRVAGRGVRHPGAPADRRGVRAGGGAARGVLRAAALLRPRDPRRQREGVTTGAGRRYRPGSHSPR
jgi:hypothetical protein